MNSPIVLKESIYIPILGFYLINEYLNYKYKERNEKLEKLSNKKIYKIRKILNQIIFIINILIVKDVEAAS